LEEEKKVVQYFKQQLLNLSEKAKENESKGLDTDKVIQENKELRIRWEA